MTPNQKLLKAAKARVHDGTRIDDAVRSGADPNLRDEYKHTPFIWCARKGNIAAARALVAAGADIEARDAMQRTAIHHSVLHRRSEFLDYLLSIGADVSALEMHGCSALDLALWDLGQTRGDPKIIPRLTALGAPAPKHPKYTHATAANA